MGSNSFEKFLFTFSNFATSKEVLERLIFIYCRAYEDEDPHVTWFRIVNVIKQWVTKFFDFWQNDTELSETLLNFLQSYVLPTLPKQAQLVNSLIEKLVKKKNSQKTFFFNHILIH